MDAYKAILTEIVRPIMSLSKFQMVGVTDALSRGSIEQRLCGESLSRLDTYINLLLKLDLERDDKLNEFAEYLRTMEGTCENGEDK